MNKRYWKTRIKKACIEVGTYQKPFDAVIETLAGILEQRDQALEEFETERELIVNHVTKTGAVNREQNPIVRLLNDYNRDALAYWRDLGLTPAGLKRINDAAAKAAPKQTALEKALVKLSG